VCRHLAFTGLFDSNSEIVELIDYVGNQVAEVHSDGVLHRRKGIELIKDALSGTNSWIVDYQRTGILRVPKLEDLVKDGSYSFAEQMIEVSAALQIGKPLKIDRNYEIHEELWKGGGQSICLSTFL